MLNNKSDNFVDTLILIPLNKREVSVFICCQQKQHVIQSTPIHPNISVIIQDGSDYSFPFLADFHYYRFHTSFCYNAPGTITGSTPSNNQITLLRTFHPAAGEPFFAGTSYKHLFKLLWQEQDSNLRPHGHEPCELPTAPSCYIRAARARF